MRERKDRSVRLASVHGSTHNSGSSRCPGHSNDGTSRSILRQHKGSSAEKKYIIITANLDSKIIDEYGLSYHRHN